MKEIELFFNDKEKRFYFVGNAHCASCESEIEHMIFIHVVLDRLMSFKKCYCAKCVSKIKHPRNLAYSEIKPAIVVSKVPQGCRPYWFTSPVLTNSSNLSVFEAAAIQDCKITDKTIHGGRETFDGCLIGSEEKVKELDSKFYQDPDKFLENTLKVTPILPQREKKEAIENKAEPLLCDTPDKHK